MTSDKNNDQNARDDSRPLDDNKGPSTEPTQQGDNSSKK